MMTNKQLAVARKVANQFPDVTFTAVEGGVSVNGNTVTITPNMTPAAVEQALKAAAYE
jgi:hypothetical protein